MLSSATLEKWLALFLTLSLATIGVAATPIAQSESRPGSSSVQESSAEALDSDSSLLESTGRQRRLVAGLIRAEVDNELRNASSHLTSDSTRVTKELQLLSARVTRAPELSASQRAELLGRLQTALTQSSRGARAQELVDQQTQAARADARDNLHVAEGLLRDQERTKQLTARYQSLMEEGRYTSASSMSSANMQQPGTSVPTGINASLVSDAAASHAADLARRSAYKQGVLDAFGAEHQASIPYADDRAITYPDAATWQKITATRKPTPVHLKTVSPGEAKIRQELKANTSIDFSLTPLSDVVDYLKDLHGIEIQLDSRSLDDAGVPSDVLITRKVKDVSLRSALRLILEALDLTYLIEDDVLLITTPDRASHEFVIRAYPVGDLLPIKTYQSRYGRRGY